MALSAFRGRCGFTLVEVLVALTVLGAMIVAFMQLYQGNSLAILSSGQRSEALLLAQSELEAAIAQGTEEEPLGKSISFTDGKGASYSVDVLGIEKTVAIPYGKAGRVVSLTAYVLQRAAQDD